jgi:hypothetical protein
MLARARNAFREGFEVLMLRRREAFSPTRSE